MNTVILESFLTVVQYKSFTQASQVLQVTQPTISNHIAALEQLYGVDLFQREGKNAVLTSAGRAFVPVAERLLAAHKQSIQEMAVFKEHLPILRIGLTAQSIIYKLSDVMTKFHKEYPNQVVKFETHFSLDELVQAIKNKEVDFGFINYDVQPLYTKRVRMWEEKLYIVCSKKLYEEHNCSRDIYEYPFIAYSDRLIENKALDMSIDYAKLKTVLVTNDSLTMLKAVADGTGIALLPGNRVEMYKKVHQDAVIFNEPGLVGRGVYSLIYDSEMDLNQPKQRLIELLEKAKEL